MTRKRIPLDPVPVSLHAEPGVYILIVTPDALTEIYGVTDRPRDGWADVVPEDSPARPPLGSQGLGWRRGDTP